MTETAQIRPERSSVTMIFPRTKIDNERHYATIKDDDSHITNYSLCVLMKTLSQ